MTPTSEQNDHELMELAPVGGQPHGLDHQNPGPEEEYSLENVFLIEPAQSKVEIVFYISRSTTSSGNSAQTQKQRAIIADPHELRTLLTGGDAQSSSRIIMIHRFNSWSRIDVTATMFHAICDLDKIMPCFLKLVRGFAKKIRSSDENFMACYSQFHLSPRDTSCVNSDSTTTKPQDTRGGTSCEFTIPGLALFLYAGSMCYNIRYFERHGRALNDPWSCRQSAIHVRISLSTRSASSIVIQAPREFYKEVSTVSDEDQVHPLHIHVLYLSISLRGWRDYLNHIADRLRDLELEVSICRPYSEFKLNLSSKQCIHTLRQKLYHAQCILMNTLDTVKAIRAYAETIATLWDIPSTVQQVFETGIENQANELRSHGRVISKLIDISTDTKSMYDDIMKSYQQELLHDNGVHLATIAQSDSAETKLMASIADKTYQDSRTMRIATLIALLYLPANLVLSFFSTTLVWFETGSAGIESTASRLRVHTESWIAVLVTLVLATCTILAYWFWDRKERAESHACQACGRV